jgi:adenosylcobinamide-GDP ribazoletransferase
VRGVRAAFVLLTRVRVGGFPYRQEDWVWALAHAPLVGAAIGLTAGGIDRALAPLGELAAAALAVGASMMLTGALHEDGLADTSDALGGGSDKERVLAILKDSRVGAFGAAALAITIVARVVLIARLGAATWWMLALVGCGARVGPTFLVAALPYVTGEGSKSRAFALAGWLEACVALGWLLALGGTAIATGLLGAIRFAVLVMSLACVTVVTGWRYRRRAGGITGDFLGATEQLGEIAALAVLAWCPP